jgi:hypothetical protein
VQRLGLPSSFGVGGRRGSNRGKKRKAAHEQGGATHGCVGGVTSGGAAVGDSAEKEEGGQEEAEGGAEASEEGQCSKEKGAQGVQGAGRKGGSNGQGARTTVYRRQGH